MIKNKKFMKKVVLLLTYLFFTGCSSEKFGSRIIDIDAKEAFEIINNYRDTLTILDIRTASEYSAGHIKDAINIDFYSKDFRDKLSLLDKDKTYLLYCRTGNRTSKALADFKELGFKKIYHLYGGISDWRNSGLPVYK